MKMKDLYAKCKVIDMDLLKCDICKSKYHENHYDIESDKTFKIINPTKIFRNKSIIYLSK